VAGSDLGVFRWQEDSARWQVIGAALGDVWAVAVHPLDPDLIIAGTRPAGFHRSTDGGVTWQAACAPGIAAFSEVNMGPTRVTQILFDPRDPDVVWAGVEIGGIYRSTDRGVTWTLKDRGLISGDVHGIAVVPKADGGTVLFATTNRGLHRSTDEGETWALQVLDSPWQYTRAIQPRADHRGTLFLTNGDGPPGTTGRLLVSHDHGDHWTEVTLPGRLNSTPWCVATDASDPLRIYVCTNLGQLFVSTDGGASFERLPHEFGELRSLLWRTLPAGIRQSPHSITKRPPPPSAA
jgi:photosystem II stability/assembly factor-like uncharacterized protein